MSLARIFVGPVAGQRARGKMLAGPCVIPCALGGAGLLRDKREGDGGTPKGRFGLRGVWQRSDRIRGLRPPALLPRRLTRPDDGWCDAPRDACYNRPVRLPFRGSAEVMRRQDGLYDLVVEIGHNLDFPRKGRGSAIFLHVAHPDLRPTAGCVAVRKADLMRLWPRLSRRTTLAIGR
jgi:L,D-peptidoglycan transpeptidase YkuD (ErfK/YbiS/YcfS/YnhG family)